MAEDENEGRNVVAILDADVAGRLAVPGPRDREPLPRLKPSLAIPAPDIEAVAALAGGGPPYGPIFVRSGESKSFGKTRCPHRPIQAARGARGFRRDIGRATRQPQQSPH